jgi:exodeoxyribonuclease V alpha subunit
MSVTFNCKIVRCTFSAKDSDYRIYAVDSKNPSIKKNKYGNSTILGNLPELGEGVEYTITADMEHGRYGTQYRVITFSRELPISSEGVRLFLNEILTAQQAEEIYREYPDILTIMMEGREEEIDVNKLYNIKHERIKSIKKKVIENFVFAKMIEEFKGLINFTIIKNLYSQYNDVQIVKKEIIANPYGVICDVGELSFKEADKMLLEFEKECSKLENPPIKFHEPLITSKMRCEQCMVYCLKQNEFEGNTKMEIKRLYKDVKSTTPQCISRFEEVLSNSELFYSDDNWIANIKTYNAELFIAETLVKMSTSKNIWELNMVGYDNVHGLTEQQLGVIKNVSEHNVSICNGFGGSGKSYSTKSLVEILKSQDKIVELLAPTGRAAKVSREYAQHPASTIHRALYQLMGNSLKYLMADIVIIDEFSMVDVMLFEWLLKSINTNHTKLLLIGDSAQLMSVSCGNLLHNILDSQSIPNTSLDKIFRYGKGGIMTVATDTRNGMMTVENKSGIQVVGEDNGYVYVPSNNAQHAITAVKSVYTKAMQVYPIEDILVLSPYNVGTVGTNVLNEVLHPIANPDSINSLKYVEFMDTKFYVGDMILQTKNNYKTAKYIKGFGMDDISAIRDSYEYKDEMTETLITNGDIGKILEIDDIYMLVDFDGEKVVYAKYDMNTLKHAYAISVTKSQGGSAKVIILITMAEHQRNLNSNLLYVGVTRAKEKIYHIGELSVIESSVCKKAEMDRNTHLKELLILEKGILNEEN